MPDDRLPTSKPIKSPEQKKEIPLSWFMGVGRQARGISAVGLSEEFYSLGGEELRDAIVTYSHIQSNADLAASLSGKDPSEFMGGDEGKEKLEKAKLFIKKTTGFTAKELFDKQGALTLQYRGKTEAPFALDLF